MVYGINVGALLWYGWALLNLAQRRDGKEVTSKVWTTDRALRRESAISSPGCWGRSPPRLPGLPDGGDGATFRLIKPPELLQCSAIGGSKPWGGREVPPGPGHPHPRATRRQRLSWLVQWLRGVYIEKKTTKLFGNGLSNEQEKISTLSFDAIWIASWYCFGGGKKEPASLKIWGDEIDAKNRLSYCHIINEHGTFFIWERSPNWLEKWHKVHKVLWSERKVQIAFSFLDKQLNKMGVNPHLSQNPHPWSSFYI